MTTWYNSMHIPYKKGCYNNADSRGNDDIPRTRLYSYSLIQATKITIRTIQIAKNKYLDKASAPIFWSRHQLGFFNFKIVFSRGCLVLRFIS
ncbi:hypothetical protein L484_008975 [Morus notabilis]|uniref:Uncharacterized protein n=1 Tax=Morus notabilis TaxID=981085 RepID=W9SL66_9ROSA|nr:hypothetical protein L484_008975 [Morus notabilis]